MIATVLVEHPWLSPTALLVLVLAGPLLGWWLVGRPRVAWALTALSLLPVVVLTTAPVDRAVADGCAVQWALPTFGRVEPVANVVLFVAPALLAGVASRRPAAALLLGSALSVGIEALQASVPAIGRSCDTTDWLSNTIGAALGALLAAVALLVARRQAVPAGRGSSSAVT